MSNPRDFGATGDGTTDDTSALQHAIDQGDGLLELPRGTYRITSTLTVDLTKTGRTGITAPGGAAKLVVAAPVTALRVIGTHGGTGDPLSVIPEIWSGQRHPVLSGFEIEGAHPEADGIELVGTMQDHLHGLLV
ncbi:MAG: glycosyl hydrolase family 28-related protein, partial [Verrucomicrobiales bacterium]|nr:glycosyl hydrolase family 28-related protein [Verrucomicrobiales bacterium]